MKKILIALFLVLASVVSAESPEFGAIRIEVTPSTKHAFVSAKPQSTDATVISTAEWNAAHNAPKYTACQTPPGVVWLSQPAGITVFAGATSLHCLVDLTYAASARLIVPTLVAGAASAVIRAQYSLDLTCSSGWAYLDDATGPSVSIASVGQNASSVITIATAARAPVCIRLVGLAP